MVRARHGAGRWVREDGRWIGACVALGFAILIVLGVSSSSLGMPQLTQDGTGSDVIQWGVSRGIRSDEYNAIAPIDLSIIKTNGSPTLSPLGASGGLVQRFPGGPFSMVTFFDATMMRLPLIPDASLFAARWWAPVIMLLFGMAAWFQALGYRALYGWLCGGLILLSPVVAWWSLGPVRTFGFTVAGCAFLACAVRRWNFGGRWIPALQAVVGGILVAGMLAGYLPWSVILGVPFLAATIGWAWTRPVSWRLRIAPVAIGAGSSLIFGLGTLWEFRDTLSSLLGTVYPGSRRSAALAQPFQFLFGAPALSPLQRADPVGTNASELSSSFTISFLILGGLALTHAYLRWRRIGAASWILIGSSAVFLLWSTLSLAFTAKIPMLSSIPPFRAAAVVGVLGVILLCMAVAKLRRTGWRETALMAIAAGGLSAYASGLLRSTFLPTTTGWTVIAVGLGVAVAVVLMLRWSDRWWAVGLTLALAAIPVWQVNPVLFQLGDLRGSPTADYLAEAGSSSRSAGEYWVSDSGNLNVVMLANGVPSLSGLQRSGPNVDEWERLDPDRRFESAWNRGGGYVNFQFTPGVPLEIATDGFDQIFVRVDPCDLAELYPEMGHIASPASFDLACLTPASTIEWGGSQYTVYEVEHG